MQGEHSILWWHFDAPEIYAEMTSLEIQCDPYYPISITNFKYKQDRDEQN